MHSLLMMVNERLQQVRSCMMQCSKHIKDGKEDLNFNRFTSYSQRRQLSKLKSVLNSIKDGSMPLSSYTLVHNDAKLFEESKHYSLIGHQKP